MMHFRFSISHAASHFVDIELTIQTNGDETLLKLPVWRPGRYEEGNFAKNIRNFKVQDISGKEVKWKKVSKSSWLLQTNKRDTIKINYQYYCNQLDAGACFVNDEQIYINPIHCCFYTDDNRGNACTVEIAYNFSKVATSLTPVEKNIFSAKNYDELVDSPFIASDALKHYGYTVADCRFNVWIQGNYKPDIEKLIKDFKSFTEVQLNMMKSIPVKDYHFLIQAVPHAFYHGVEHLASTVLVIGPSANLNDSVLYNELLGVASHELFHVWNIKTIRPVEMQPYNYDSPNYAETGFVYEGATTYYGDLFLARCGYFSEEEYFNELNIRINKHLSNEGRFNYSVAQSSFDTWLDGYVTGIPGRKTSIYDEGSLVSLILDFLIRKYSDGKNSLDDVFVELYNAFGKKKIGYTSADYLRIASEKAGRSLETFFNDIVYNACSYQSLLEEVLLFAGLALEEIPSKKYAEGYFGFKTNDSAAIPEVMNVATGSPAFENGLAVGDLIIGVNGWKADKNYNVHINQIEGHQTSFLISRGSRIKTIEMMPTVKNYFSTWKVKHISEKNSAQEQFFNQWAKNLRTHYKQRSL
ncbi:MAG: M61 family metallopeptidase [Bacteroidetes bacterium]|nr:M61 family metallopeptidase [Bacteroidota bacterium]